MSGFWPGKINVAIPVAITVIAIGIGMFQSDVATTLQYQSNFDQSGEVWRLLTAHVVHLDPMHLALNLGGLWLVWLIVGNVFNNDQWLLLVVLVGCAITLGLRFWFPDVTWYVGLSGLLYGLLVAGLVMQLTRRNLAAMVLLAVILIKTIIDRFYMPISFATLTEYKVVVDAHIIGIGAGLILSGCFRLLCRTRPSMQ